MTIDITKTYKTRDGREVVLFSDKGIGNDRILGAIICMGSVHIPCTWPLHGARFGNGGKHHDLDLIEVKPRIKRTFWMNAYNYRIGDLYSSKEAAANNCGLDVIARVKIEIDCEEGEGLEETP